VNTLNLMRGAVAAQSEGVFRPYVEAVYDAMWRTPRKLDDPEVWRQALAEAGLDADRLMARSQTPDVKAQLIATTEKAVARGAFGSPTFFVGEQMFFGKDQLRDVEDEVLRQAAANTLDPE
jgi:2-hydroxychromene-2-carboxylate isomerase